MKLKNKVTDMILNVAVQTDAVQLILQTLIDSQELEGEFTLKGDLELVPVINK